MEFIVWLKVKFREREIKELRNVSKNTSKRPIKDNERSTVFGNPYTSKKDFLEILFSDQNGKY